MHATSLFALCLFSLAAAAAAPPEGTAPHAPRRPSQWSSGIKQGFGTAYEAYDPDGEYSAQSATAPISKVWFTLAQGVLTEVYWPTNDTPQVRDLQILATDGKELFEERTQAVSEVRWLQTGVPAYLVTNRDPKKRFTIEKTFYTDPDRDVVLQRVRITRHVPGWKFYVLHNPSVGNTPLGNSALASTGAGRNAGPGEGLFAWQGAQAQALVSSLPFTEVSAGFSTFNDGFVDLSQHHKMTHHYQWALEGDVVLTGGLPIPETVGTTELTLALGFGKDLATAHQQARESLALGHDWVLGKYTSQWVGYQASLDDLTRSTEDGGKLFRASAAVLKSSEDKTHVGAFIASPAVPWGLTTNDWNVGPPSPERRELTSGYHQIWPRDLYHVATAFLALHDYASAAASLRFLRSAQYGPSDGEWAFGWRRHAKNGSFPQNAFADGQTMWAGLQLDEAADPIILAYRLWKSGRVPPGAYWDMVKRAGDFIADFGPWSPMERWEETIGASPSTIAAEIAGLFAASQIAEAVGDVPRAARFRATYEAWSTKPNDNLDTWTFTTTGAHGNGRYFERIEGAKAFDQVWNPNDDVMFTLANNTSPVREKDVVDGGFLELVRLGVRPALDPHVLDTVVVYDKTIRVEVPGHGPSFYRYLGDRYNYEESTGQQTKGMPWPLLTGERAHYELQKAIELGVGDKEVDRVAAEYVRVMESFATPSLMLAEQVWDSGDRAGKPTGCATPLAWSHAEYLRLVRSRLDRRVFDRLAGLGTR